MATPLHSALPPPTPFFEVRVRRSDAQPPWRAYCADYDIGRWRAEELSDHIFQFLNEFVYPWSDLRKINHLTAVQMLSEAAKRIYRGGDIQHRGEFGELLLHALLRVDFQTVPAAAKLFFKTGDNDNVKGYDSAHIRDGNDGLELWFGEAKLHKDAGTAIREAVKSIADHVVPAYARREFALVRSKIDPEMPHADDMRRLLAAETKLEDVFASLHVPVLLTYDSAVVGRHTQSSDPYPAEFTAEAEAVFNRFAAKAARDLPGHISLHVCIVPVKDKEAFVELCHQRLVALQELRGSGQ